MSLNIVIIGGGFGGLETALSLHNRTASSVKITLIDRSEYHSFIPSIHEIISGRISARDIQIPLALILGITGIDFVHEEVLRVDLPEKKVITPTRALDYDYLVLSSGAENNFFNVKGAESFSCRFRSPEDAGRMHAKMG